ncbi:hypothetical protein CAPTEDRAFT_190516 [Capitella teleta]|uniref:Uncharacterized protein n=1 Tax=Capitella teleta TaxID=283909 RepID=R7TN64_CAPTE|nr:hypothetical protein CAPTEDRAFT_190516 [Capitella teleta]|eukprot:ELT92996.1 hypothetical protein CAPTEDRAFT_190516 [Capitella teleta]
MTTAKEPPPAHAPQNPEDGICCCPHSALPYIALTVHYIPRTLVILGSTLLFVGVIIVAIAFSEEADSKRSIGPALSGVGGALLIGGLLWLYWRHYTKMRYEDRGVYIPPRTTTPSVMTAPKQSNVYVVNTPKDPVIKGNQFTKNHPTPEVTQQIQVAVTVEHAHAVSPDVTFGTPNIAYEYSESEDSDVRYSFINTLAFLHPFGSRVTLIFIQMHGYPTYITEYHAGIIHSVECYRTI